MNFIKNLTVALFVLMFGNLLIFSQGKDNLPKITASNIVSEVIKKKKANPKMNSRELASYANQLLAKKGFNYAFGMSDLFNQKSPPKEFPPEQKELVINFPFEFTMNDKSQKPFTLFAKKNLMNGCYDESFPAFPLIQADKNAVTVLVDGKPNKVKIPAEFLTLEALLTDTKTKKKVLQRWILPSRYGLSDYNFVGISADGKKLYVSVEDHYLIEDHPTGVKELALEISADGTIKFVPKAEVKKKFKWQYLNDGTELNDVLARITIDGKVFILAVPDTSC